MLIKLTPGRDRPYITTCTKTCVHIMLMKLTPGRDGPCNPHPPGMQTKGPGGPVVPAWLKARDVWSSRVVNVRSSRVVNVRSSRVVDVESVVPGRRRPVVPGRRCSFPAFLKGPARPVITLIGFHCTSASRAFVSSFSLFTWLSSARLSFSFEYRLPPERKCSCLVLSPAY